ncbi:MAG: hypothetical protein QM702_00195 [Rubrivivax sp.]
MSLLTDFAENKFVDWLLRAQAWTPGGSLYAALASAASDGSIAEISGTAYARQALSRALATWAGTQAAGSTTASTGTSHTTSNNAAINFGSAGSAWGSVTHLVIYDASTSGNPIAYIPLPNGTLTVATSDPVSFAAGSISFSLGLTGGCTDYLANKLIDWLFRGQTYTPQTPLYRGLFTAAPTNAGGGTEVSGGSYARASIVPSLANMSGTQGAGSTAASNSSSGQTSNNVSIAFPAPTGSWGTVTHAGWFDASTGGNLLFWSALTTPRTIASGQPAPVWNPGSATITFA